ncbi:popeye domain-containing protein 3 isoform X2 [Phyllopteryx taeniolatus]|uniref:popeye domain-containing protein 3 isoform X2 n=1 Tax=Phyllopteryx taeniolatus TaxID=161469 RepID=UPI002AD50B2C|nr:popeye domain-containing protein 3 isoform X2 [Phyllopteryx taeniolatus]
MEPPGFEATNVTVKPAESAYPLCEEWKDGSESSVFHLANIFLFLGFMGGSGIYGLFYVFTFLTLGYLCATLWAWADSCSATDAVLWSFALLAVCLGQVVHAAYRIRSVSFDRDFQELYNCVFKKIGVSLSQFGKIVACCEGDIRTIKKDHCFAIEGKTTIDKLSLLMSGRRGQAFAACHMFGGFLSRPCRLWCHRHRGYVQSHWHIQPNYVPGIGCCCPPDRPCPHPCCAGVTRRDCEGNRRHK